MNKIKPTGFSIVELLIAMVISLTLIFACASVYSSLRASIDRSQQLSNAQESLRGAHYLLSRSVRQGYALKVSGAGASQSIVVTYGPEATGNFFYGCLGERQEDGGTDSFFIDDDSKNEKQLYCTTTAPSIKTEIIALDVQSLSAVLAPGSQKGIDITLKIKGMPSGAVGTMGVNGFTFSLAMRQRILIDAGVAGKSSASLSTAL